MQCMLGICRSSQLTIRKIAILILRVLATKMQYIYATHKNIVFSSVQ